MKRKKNYLLFLMGDFKLVNEPLTHIIETLSLVIGSPFLKYVHHDNLIIAHFESYDNMEDIHFFLDTTLNESILSYFLFPKPRNMAVRLDEELKKHLINLKTNTLTRPDILPQKLNESLIHISEALEGYTQQVTTESEKKEYNLDEILDKISEDGMDSLTTQEKEFLQNLSKC
jgi:hypothetical protein